MPSSACTLLVLSLLLYVCGALGSVAPSGFLTSLNIAAIENIEATFLPVLEKAFTSITVPDIHEKHVDTPIGHVDIDLTSIHINVTDWGHFAISFSETGVSVNISGFTMKGSMDWAWSMKYMSDHGSADLKVKDVAIGLTIGLHDHSGELYLDVPYVHADVGNIDVDMHGSIVSWLYDLVIDACEGTIKDSIEDSIEDSLPDAILDISEDTLATMVMVAPIDSEEYIFLYLTGDPVVTADSLSLYAQGQFGQYDDPSWVYPLTIVPHTLSDGDFTSLQLVITEDVPNSLLALSTDRGVLGFNITNADVGADFEKWWPLTIRSLAVFMPGLRDIFPDQDMEFYMQLEPSEYPTVSFSDSDGMHLAADATISAIACDGYQTDIFDLDLHLALSMEPLLMSNSTDVFISAVFEFEDMDLDTVYTITDSIDLSGLGDVIDVLFEYVIIPLWNDLFEVIGGIPLPLVPGVQFVNSSFLYGDRLFQIATDFTFTI
ncbi:hypothetical protein KIPB_001904 [Kipferlia bialata]|uniref:Lipid-binding serum glycoprotein C-terminal domain-containing protein n=1 Tax=Kipferlia bialata TaxID=797122 RepID=A0A9K3GFQ3_9EUKA|nr:hypothetical protein KIPB_001904 [Kipferlia bialata]|eukprot:g1904.t1